MGVRATIDLKLEEQRSIIKLLLLDGEKPCHILKGCRIFFVKPVYTAPPTLFIVNKDRRVTLLDVANQFSIDKTSAHQT